MFDRIAEINTIPEKIEKILEDKERLQWFAFKVVNIKDAVACHAKRKKLTRKTKKTLLNTTFKSVFFYL